MRRPCFLLLLAGAWAFGGCDAVVGKRGSGVAAEEERAVDDFNELSVTGRIKAQVVVGPKTRFLVVGDDNLLDMVVAKVRGKRLYVSNRDGAGFRPLAGLEVQIETPELNKLSVSGASTVRVVDADSADFDLEASGASTVSLAGKAEDVSFDLSGAARVSASQLEAKTVRVKVSGASRLSTSASQEIRGEASGASDVAFTGNPKSVRVQSSGASSVRKK